MEFFLEGREREPQFQMLTLTFIGKHIQMLYLKFNQNRIIDEECGGMEGGFLKILFIHFYRKWIRNYYF